jgi:inosine-uridine nucleoside N-ribohydrolase
VNSGNPDKTEIMLDSVLIFWCLLKLLTGSITLVAIGALTNIAVALMLDPDFGTKLKDCVIMGGNYLG